MISYLRIAVRYFLYLFVLAVVLAAGATAVLTLTDGGRATLASTVSGLASGPGRTVRLSDIDGIWSGHLTAAELVLEDDSGPWARLTGITLDWSPLALLGFAFDAENIIVERVEIERPPEAADTEPGGQFSLPVTIDVADLELRDVRLGQALAGVAARLSATGSLVIDNAPLALTADLAVDRIDDRAGSLTATIAFVPSENRLELNVNGSEPAGGLIASMLRLPGVPPVEIGVSGKGDAADWRGKATFSVDGAVAASIEGRHQLTDNGSRIEATGTGNFHPFLPDSFADIAQGETVFSLAGIVRPWTAASVERLTLNSATVELTASGSLDPERVSDFQLSARATGDPVILRYGQVGDATTARLRSLTARAFGPGDALSFTVNADLARFESAGLAAEDIVVSARSDAFDLPARSGPVDLTVRSDAAGSVMPVLANLLAGEVSLNAQSVVSPEAVSLERVAVKTGTVTAEAKGRYGIADQSLALDFSGDMLSAVLPVSARPFLDRSMALSGRAERSAAGAVSLTGAQVRSGSLSIAGDASLNGDEIDADISGAFDDLSLLSSAAAGKARFALQASGEMSRPQLTANVSSDGVTVAGRELSGLTLDADISADRAAPQGEITLSGNVGSDALTGKAVLKSSEGRSEIGNLALSLGDNRLTGALTLDSELVPDGTVQFDFPDFGALAALALVDVSGVAAGTIRFTRQDGVPRVVVEANAPRVAMEAAQAVGISISAIAENYIEAPVVSGQLQADGVTAGGADIRNARVDLSRDGAWTSFDGSAIANGTPATASGRVKVEDGDVTLELADADATYRDIKASLAAPSTIVVANGTARLDGLTANAAGGSASVSGTAGSDLNLRVAINVLPAGMINAFVPGLGADGTVAGSADIKGKASNPEIAYDLKWTGGRTAQTRAAGLGAMNVGSKGTYSGGTVRFDATVGDGSGLTMKGGGSVDVPARSLDVSFNGSVPFGFLASRLAAQGVALNGAATVALKIGGGFGAPQVSGSVRTSEARLIHAPSGVAIDDLTAVVELGGGVATVSAMRGRLSTGGTITGSGTVGIEPSSGFPADLNLNIDNGRYTDGRVVTANFDGSLTLKGPVTNNPVLGGQINLGRTVVTIPDGLPPSLSQLDVEHRNAPAAVVRQQEALRPSTGGAGGGGLSLDLDISAPREIIVQGRGLDAELGGNLRLTGPASSVSALGQFDLRRGRLEFLGRRLDFRRGTLGFSGSLIPYLNFAADTRAESATVTVLITGPANNPAFSFESTPILPEDEILARLLFGKAMSGLSPVQIAQLASAAAQLAGIGGSTTLLQRLRERVGVDDIDVRTDAETGDTSVSVGKYLNDRTYLSIEKGSQPGSGKAIIDLDVGGGVKLRGEASDSGATSGGIFYEKEY